MDHRAKLDQSNNPTEGPWTDAERENFFEHVSDGGSPPLEVVLLDVDGTLVGSNEAHAMAWSRAANEFGYDRPEALFRELIGMGADQILPRIDITLQADSHSGKALAARRGEIFLAAFAPALAATPGAKALVERFRDSGLRCVIASSSRGAELETLLEIAGVGELVEARPVLSKSDASKPAPDVIQSALRLAHVTADRALLLGDTPYDVAAAANAGVETVALRCGGWDDARLAGALAIYDDPAHLLAEYASSPFAPLPADVAE
jgi:beta-phosphoglucomutase-like phosphatase (HAD superfamily)